MKKRLKWLKFTAVWKLNALYIRTESRTSLIGLKAVYYKTLHKYTVYTFFHYFLLFHKFFYKKKKSLYKPLNRRSIQSASYLILNNTK